MEKEQDERLKRIEAQAEQNGDRLAELARGLTLLEDMVRKLLERQGADVEWTRELGD